MPVPTKAEIKTELEAQLIDVNVNEGVKNIIKKVLDRGDYETRDEHLIRIWANVQSKTLNPKDMMNALDFLRSIKE